MAGYSGKPLSQKLGIKEGSKVAVLNLPDGCHLDLPETGRELTEDLDLVLFFTIDAEELQQAFPSLIGSTVQNGSIWISWPKKTSGVPTDLNENVVRDIGLEAGVVDVKVCAVDETWSGLKFVRRLRDRR